MRKMNLWKKCMMVIASASLLLSEEAMCQQILAAEVLETEIEAEYKRADIATGSPVDVDEDDYDYEAEYEQADIATGTSADVGEDDSEEGKHQKDTKSGASTEEQKTDYEAEHGQAVVATGASAVVVAEPQTEAQKPQPVPVQKTVVSVNQKKEIGKANYKVTAVNQGNGEVAFSSTTAKKASKVVVPDTVKIDESIFKVAVIEKKAFKNNKKLKKVVIGKNVREIGAEAFAGCVSLKSVTVPKNVTTIGKNAFKGSKKLKTIKITSTKLKTVKKNAFKGIGKNAVIKVPKKSYKKYKKMFKKAGLSRSVKVKKY